MWVSVVNIHICIYTHRLTVAHTLTLCMHCGETIIRFIYTFFKTSIVPFGSRQYYSHKDKNTVVILIVLLCVMSR